MGFLVYLPLIIMSLPVMGVQIDTSMAGMEQWIVTGMVYQSPARWNGIDEWLPSNVLAFGENPVIIGSKTCPPEYRLWPDFLGSPPKPEYYDEYAAWAVSVIEEYHPLGWELWNEPDVPKADSEPFHFGSWVEENDFYAGGYAYGEFTKAVYPALHATGVKVIAGALWGTPSSLEFARGMRDAGFEADFVSFHKNMGMNDNFDTGFVFADALYEIVQRPLIMSETSIAGDGGTEHQNRKAEYMRYIKEMFELELTGPVVSVLWYALRSGWLGTDLITDGGPQPAYDVWKD